MQIVSTCSIDPNDFEMNESEEERENQAQDTDSDSEAANLSSMTAKTEMTKYKKESNDPQDKDILLLPDIDNTDYLNVYGLDNTDEYKCPPSALGILLEDLVQRFESKENIPTDELLTIIDKIIQTEAE